MTGRLLCKLVALAALVGVFAMHGFAVGADGGGCLTMAHDAPAHQVGTQHGAAADATGIDATGIDATASTQGRTTPAGMQATGTRAVAPGVAGMCLAVLLASTLLALLLLTARRRRAMAGPDPVPAGRGLPARRGPPRRIRGPSPVQLCVLRT